MHVVLSQMRFGCRGLAAAVKPARRYLVCSAARVPVFSTRAYQKPPSQIDTAPLLRAQSAVKKGPRPRVVRPVSLGPLRAAASDVTASEYFYAADDVSFASLKIGSAVSQSLKAAGFARPTHIQELTAPAILSGKNAAITAETGSGKTLSYLAPLATLLLNHREQEQQRLTEDNAYRLRRRHALVLCPNSALCQQVAAVATSALARGPDGRPLLTAALVNSSNPPAFEPPDIILATPAGLLTVLSTPGYGRLWSAEGLQAAVQHVVLDEADLLMGKAYLNPLTRILDMFKTVDRRNVEAKVCEELGIEEAAFDRLPRLMQLAAWKGGSRALLDAGFRTPAKVAPDAAFGPYYRRQYIFAAATMPAVLADDVGARIQRSFPDAVWLSTELLHRNKPNITHEWMEVTEHTCADALLSVLQKDADAVAKQGAQVLVFAGDGTMADQISRLLTTRGVAHVTYHKGRPAAECEAALAAMSRKGAGGVMVCTDAAARGIDLPNVTHIVQADFASNAVAFLHRVGRTARGTSAGRVTSLYREHNAPLVSVLRRFIEEGRPLEAAFSRARQFSRKMKRYGEFVPRGIGSTAQYQRVLAKEGKAAGAEAEEAPRKATGVASSSSHQEA